MSPWLPIAARRHSISQWIAKLRVPAGPRYSHRVDEPGSWLIQNPVHWRIKTTVQEMYWRFKRLEQQIKQRANMQRCQRCRLLYQKSLPQCPHCSGVSDAELRNALAQRARFRKQLVTWMIGTAFFIILLLAVM